MSCLFCQIAEKKIPAFTVFEDDQVLAFHDIKAQAPHHLLIIPKKHIATVNDLATEDTLLVGHLVQTAKNLAKNLGIAEEGYRLVFNCNQNGGQAVFHIHLHLLGGRPMAWPPG